MESNQIKKKARKKNKKREENQLLGEKEIKKFEPDVKSILFLALEKAGITPDKYAKKENNDGSSKNSRPNDKI